MALPKVLGKHLRPGGRLGMLQRYAERTCMAKVRESAFQCFSAASPTFWAKHLQNGCTWIRSREVHMPLQGSSTA